ncbi:uracil-DNA glycosylase family protein [Novosphingobium soli]|uniref:Uracil-DNA glycosylase family protein n=1 Tax=Novosphingobium soli TaxID=574956 RepID=A0ABV6CXB3_9SPHN
MDDRPNPEFLDDITGALDWWRDAGVDCDFLDEPVDWLAAAERAAAPLAEARRERPAPVEPAPSAPPVLKPEALPSDLASFASWWLSEPLLSEGDLAARIAPQGPAGAELMVLVEEPEAEDRESLLSGPQGRLLDAMLAAFGTRRDEIYLASALPRHTPGADWAALGTRGVGAALAHHIALAAPRRLFVLGGNALSLIGHESPQRPAVLRLFNHEGASIPLLASWALPALLAQPRAKPVLWEAWLEWTAA